MNLPALLRPPTILFCTQKCFYYYSTVIQLVTLPFFALQASLFQHQSLDQATRRRKKRGFCETFV